MNKKSLLVSIISILLPSLSIAGSSNGWIYQTPYPTSSTLLAAKFMTPNNGWVAGEYGIILYTDDGGKSWELQESGTWEDIKSIAFINDRIGWAVGKEGSIIHTEDGGKRWEPQKNVKASLHKVFFLNEKEGWTVGDNGLVRRTNDGGKNWDEKSIGIRQSISSIFFINSNIGWLLAGKKVYRTTDGGDTWESSDLQINDQKGLFDETWWEGDIFFLNNNEGWAVVGISSVHHTIDGGKTWEVQLGDAGIFGFKINTIGFTDGKNGCAAGSSILCTYDGGKSWTERLGIKQAYEKINGFESGFWGMSFADPTTAIAVGYGGLIMKAEDGAKTWKLMSKGIEPFSRIFIEDKTGFGFRPRVDGRDSSIIRSDDGGNTWQTLKKFNGPLDLSAKYFFNANTGWMAGAHEKQSKSWNSLIVHTNDGGKTWLTQYDEPGDTILEIFFGDQSTGWAVGMSGLILHTKDGGKKWVRQKSGTKFWLEYVFFLDANKGWVLGSNPAKSTGDESILLHTEDGGTTWRIQTKIQDLWLTQVFFRDDKIGWITAVSGASGGEGAERAALLYTRNGGKSWDVKDFKDISYASLEFLDKDRGVLFADKGRNYITIDGGKTWERRRDPVHKGRKWHVSELFEKTKGN